MNTLKSLSSTLESIADQVMFVRENGMTLDELHRRLASIEDSLIEQANKVRKLEETFKTA